MEPNHEAEGIRVAPQRRQIVIGKGSLLHVLLILERHPLFVTLIRTATRIRKDQMMETIFILAFVEEPSPAAVQEPRQAIPRSQHPPFSLNEGIIVDVTSAAYTGRSVVEIIACRTPK